MNRVHPEYKSEALPLEQGEFKAFHDPRQKEIRGPAYAQSWPDTITIYIQNIVDIKRVTFSPQSHRTVGPHAAI